MGSNPAIPTKFAFRGHTGGTRRRPLDAFGRQRHTSVSALAVRLPCSRHKITYEADDDADRLLVIDEPRNIFTNCDALAADRWASASPRCAVSAARKAAQRRCSNSVTRASSALRASDRGVEAVSHRPASYARYLGSGKSREGVTTFGCGAGG